MVNDITGSDKMNKFKNNKTIKILKELQKESIKHNAINESTFVFHYGQGRNKFAHELKAFTLKDALKKFIEMYKIPKEEWDKIVVKKSKWF